MGAITTRRYDDEGVEAIRTMLDAQAKDNAPLLFEVKVDGTTRILRTKNVERFREINGFLNENTSELLIVIYPDENDLKRKEWHKFKFDGFHMEGLNGKDVQSKINESLKQYQHKVDMERLQEKLGDTKKQLEDAESYIDELEYKLEEAKGKTNHLGNIDLGKLAGTAVQEIAIHYPKVLDKVPVLNGIAKAIQEEQSAVPTPTLNGHQLNGAVSFKPKSKATPAASPEASEHDEAIRRLSEFIGEHFDQDQKALLGEVIVALGDDPAQLAPIAELLGIGNDANLNGEEQES